MDWLKALPRMAVAVAGAAVLVGAFLVLDLLGDEDEEPSDPMLDRLGDVLHNAGLQQ